MEIAYIACVPFKKTEIVVINRYTSANHCQHKVLGQKVFTEKVLETADLTKTSN